MSVWYLRLTCGVARRQHRHPSPMRTVCVATGAFISRPAPTLSEHAACRTGPTAVSHLSFDSLLSWGIHCTV
jgi:hypothetical protein